MREDLRVMNDAINHRGGDGDITEAFAPTGKRQVRRHDQRTALIPARHQLEEQVRRVRLDRDIANLVNDEQVVPAELGQ